ncbi:MAG: RNA polymerase sigma factor [Candidatus Kapabacteria bacterium]|nr:RNA polymerase sigma factor [Candidatus Kapabacteria bacterium]
MNGLRDDPAFLKVLEDHHDALARFARSLTRSTEDAKDLVAETILKAYESWSTIREPGAARTFLFRIAHRIYIRQNIRRKLFGPYNPEVDIASSDPLPDHLADAQLVRDALQKLPIAQRECLVLVDVLGWSLEEVVLLHGGTVGGLKAKLFRARQELKRRLTSGGSYES